MTLLLSGLAIAHGAPDPLHPRPPLDRVELLHAAEEAVEKAAERAAVGSQWDEDSARLKRQGRAANALWITGIPVAGVGFGAAAFTGLLSLISCEVGECDEGAVAVLVGVPASVGLAGTGLLVSGISWRASVAKRRRALGPRPSP